jgi:hypothetical protein
MARSRRTRSSAGRQPPPRAQAPRATRAPRFDRALAGSVVAVLVVLFLLGDDRHVGLVADGRQMIRTAVALAETGEIGQARGRDFTVDRANGDAVSRFGLAMSLLQVPAGWLAPAIEARRGPGSSQALFLVVPWLAVGVAAGAAGALARRLGGGHFEVAAAAVLASIASPLGSYAWMEFSEPVQAAALTAALALALTAAQSADRRHGLELAAGFAAGFAVLAKSSLIIAAPLMLLPLMGARRGGLRWAAAGAAVPMALWVAGELARFGHFFGGYPDDRFTHPWWDGAWRLLVGPNRGLLLFWPALLLFGWAGRRWWKAPIATPESRAWLAAGLALTAQLAVAAGYWAWHGMEGWGPRLILAAVPLLAPFVATAPVPSRTYVLSCVVVLCLLANAPPLVQHPTPVATYVVNLAWPEIPEREAPRYPFYATSRASSGRTTVVPFAVLEREPAANPWQLYLWFWRSSHAEGEDLASRLLQPPWVRAQPSLVPAVKWPPDVARQVAPPPRWGFLGRSLTSRGGPYATVYLDALLDQVVRANQQGRIPRALDLSARRLQLQTDGEAAAWRLESFRRAGLATDAETLLRSLPQDVRLHPLINVVLALFDRDAGEEARARALLGSVSRSFPNTKVDQALASPLTGWPATLDELTQPPRRDAMVVAPPR